MALSTLDPATQKVRDAVKFLILVTRNNPRKTAAQIEGRPDVQVARQAIAEYLDDARDRAAKLATLDPAIAADTAKTIVGLRFDTDITRNQTQWANRDIPIAPIAAKIALRMQWLTDWLNRYDDLTKIAEPYKRWVSRLDASTCSYCAALHGVVLPVYASFAAEAQAAGFTRPYGGLLGPPLHPNCRCTLESRSDSYYELLFTAA